MNNFEELGRLYALERLMKTERNKLEKEYGWLHPDVKQLDTAISDINSRKRKSLYACKKEIKFSSMRVISSKECTMIDIK